jgi:predicted DNA-binding transcriptional regulator YafY
MRASRLVSILILLQLRQRLTAEALAEEFEVSVRTIYRDIDALSASGVPVYGDRGPGGGFQVLDGYRTRLTGLDNDEAEAMLLIGLPQEAAAMGLGNAAARARNKLLASLPKAGSDDASRIADRFHLDTADWYRAARPTPYLSVIARAALDQRRIAVRYESWTATRDWDVEPLGLVLKAGNWYVVAHGNGKITRFNISDILELQVLPEGFDYPDGFNLSEYWNSANRDFEVRLRPLTAKISASPLGIRRLRLLGSWAAEAVRVIDQPDAKGWQILQLPIEAIEASAPQFLGIGPEIDIISPIALRDAVRKLAEQVAIRMKGPEE